MDGGVEGGALEQPYANDPANSGHANWEIFAGVGWAEAHHDVCVMSEDGQVLEQRRVSHSVAGIGELHALIAAHAGGGEPVAAGVGADGGLVVTALLAASYQV